MRALVVALVLAVPSLAFARDSFHAVCSGVVEPGDGSDRVGVSMRYDDSRAADGVRRNVAIRELVGDTVYAWKGTIAADLDTAYAIVVQAGKLVRFRGTEMLSNGSGGFTLRLHGKLVGADKQAHDIDVTLPCVDISI